MHSHAILCIYKREILHVAFPELIFNYCFSPTTPANGAPINISRNQCFTEYFRKHGSILSYFSQSIDHLSSKAPLISHSFPNSQSVAKFLFLLNLIISILSIPSETLNFRPCHKSDRSILFQTFHLYAGSPSNHTSSRRSCQVTHNFRTSLIYSGTLFSNAQRYHQWLKLKGNHTCFTLIATKI